MNLEIKQVYGWVRLPGLPYHYYHKSILRAIGEVIGNVLKIDYNMEGLEKARFARLAVKIDLTKPLVSMIKLDGMTQYVEYEGLPTICYHCGRYGHLDSVCPVKVQPQGTTPVTSNPLAEGPTKPAPPLSVAETWASETQTREEKVFSEWMKAPTRGGRYTRGSRRNPDSSTHYRVNGGNRFNILATSEIANSD
ncbi:uncharacterized protein LOC114759853 [Neltuma alba]|uniref:uncharacterized protein LOC114759853 n=1 Tax=Neltuma alba TaxID=207710 RepID=UPI0010A49676|nr:uncharacterized protein LOC114759853 [Prosopis alba]